MKKFIPLIIFAAFTLYIGCKSTSNPVSPTNSSVTFTITHLWYTDTAQFLAKPSVDVKVDYVKIWEPNGDTLSGSGLGWNWSKDTTYYLAWFAAAPTGVYKFDFKGTLTSGGASFSSTGRDTL